MGLVRLVLAAAPLGCKGDGSHDAAAHGEASASAHGHGAAEDGLTAVSVTVWTEQSELFMEYEPLIVGRPSRFAAHVTRLPEFAAATEGTLDVTMTMADGATVNARAAAPASPGIFRVTMGPPKAGPCTLTLVYELGERKDTIAAGACQAFADEPAARAAAPSEPAAGAIAFTKEQQWQIEFATTVALERELQPSVRATAEIKAVPSHESRLSAPVAGRVVLPAETPILGMRVDKGQVLASVIPSMAVGTDRATLDADVLAAQTELRAAESALGRAERLLAQQAVPARSVEEARARVEVSRARADAAKGRLDQHSAGTSGAGGAPRGSYLVRSAIAGTLVSSTVAQGESVAEGQPLFHVVDLSRIWLVAQIFEPDLPKVEAAPTAWFTADGYDEPFGIGEHGGRLVTVGHMIDARSRTAPAVFELENPGGRLRIGQFAQAFVATGEPVRTVAIPESALLEDGGRPVAFVQLEGESFSRRPVKVGIRAKGFAQVLDGVKAGERVVSRGAYQVRLAAASGAIPQHGHVH